jgi:hypothetical protein
VRWVIKHTVDLNMPYWWVNQNKTCRHEVQGGYLWSPKRKTNGARNLASLPLKAPMPRTFLASFKSSRQTSSTVSMPPWANALFITTLMLANALASTPSRVATTGGTFSAQSGIYFLVFIVK